MGEEHSPGRGTAVLVIPMPGGMETPTDTVAAMIAWLFRHGGPRTGEVLTRLERHGWTLELPDPAPSRRRSCGPPLASRTSSRREPQPGRFRDESTT